MTEVSQVDFNYGSVDADTASKLEYFATCGQALIRKSQIQFIADFGKILSEARQQLAHKGDGTFVKWAKAEFDISHQTIWNYVNAWEKCLSNSLTNYLNWTASALYMLADDEIPKPVQRTLEKIPATDMVRACDVKRLIAASQPAKPEPPDTADDEEIPFDEAPSMTPAELKAAEKKARAEKKEAKAKADKKAKADAKLLKDAERAKARELKKEAAAKAAEQKKADAKAAREKARADAAAAKLTSLPADDQVKALWSMIQQHLDKAVRLLDDLHRVKSNSAARSVAVKTLQGVKLW